MGQNRGNELQHVGGQRVDEKLRRNGSWQIAIDKSGTTGPHQDFTSKDLKSGFMKLPGVI
jgi:hypothetical protein